MGEQERSLIGSFLKLVGGTMTGNINMNNNNITGLNDLRFNVDAGEISSPDSDALHTKFMARDTGVGLVEVGRLSGAADPAFTFGGSSQFVFYNSGVATLNGVTTIGTPAAYMLKFDPAKNGVYFGDASNSWDILLKPAASNYLAVRNSADSSNVNLDCATVRYSSGIKPASSNLSIQSIDSDNGYLKITARDNGVGLVEVARIVGAADPYFRMTLPLQLNPIATTSLPDSPVEGMITYDATLNKLVVFVGASWETVTSA